MINVVCRPSVYGKKGEYLPSLPRPPACPSARDRCYGLAAEFFPIELTRCPRIFLNKGLRGTTAIQLDFAFERKPVFFRLCETVSPTLSPLQAWASRITNSSVSQQEAKSACLLIELPSQQVFKMLILELAVAKFIAEIIM